MKVLIDQFQDINFHASSVREWRQTYSQITSGPLQTSLAQITHGHFHIFREFINQRVVQQGEAPRGRICFAIPLVVPGIARLQGREVDDQCILLLRGGDEFMFHMPLGTDLLGIVFECAAFERALSEMPRAAELTALMKQPVVQVSPHRLAKTRTRMLALYCEMLSSPFLMETIESRSEFEHAMLIELLNLIADPDCNWNQRLASSPGSFIVEKSHRILLSDTAQPPSVLDLCQRLRICRRTVQKSFRTVTQTTPVNYIRCIRLNGVRRELMLTSVSELSIGDAAARWGFFHLSHFAAEYQSLFGELPSRTTRPEKTRSAPAIIH